MSDSEKQTDHHHDLFGNETSIMAFEKPKGGTGGLSSDSNQYGIIPLMIVIFFLSFVFVGMLIYCSKRQDAKKRKATEEMLEQRQRMREKAATKLAVPEGGDFATFPEATESTMFHLDVEEAGSLLTVNSTVGSAHTDANGKREIKAEAKENPQAAKVRADQCESVDQTQEPTNTENNNDSNKRKSIHDRDSGAQIVDPMDEASRAKLPVKSMEGPETMNPGVPLYAKDDKGENMDSATSSMTEDQSVDKAPDTELPCTVDTERNEPTKTDAVLDVHEENEDNHITDNNTNPCGADSGDSPVVDQIFDAARKSSDVTLKEHSNSSREGAILDDMILPATHIAWTYCPKCKNRRPFRSRCEFEPCNESLNEQE